MGPEFLVTPLPCRAPSHKSVVAVTVERTRRSHDVWARRHPSGTGVDQQQPACLATDIQLIFTARAMIGICCRRVPVRKA